jgi:hypothetical protein
MSAKNGSSAIKLMPLKKKLLTAEIGPSNTPVKASMRIIHIE